MSEQSRNPRQRRFAVVATLVLVAVGLFLGIAVAEGAMRFVYRRSVDLDMEMWKYAVRLKRPSDDPEIVHTHRISATDTLMGVEVALNMHGFRGPEIEVPKPGGVYRVAFAGDSFTLGWGVPQDDTFVSLVGDWLNESAGTDGIDRFEAVNLGVGNYNTVQQVARIREAALPLAPDLIVLAFYLNDAEPQPERQDSWLLRNSFVAAFVLSRWRQLTSSRSPDYATYYRRLYEPFAPAWIATGNAFQRLQQVARERGTPVVVYIIPDLHKVGAAYPFREEHRRIAARASEARLAVVDLLPQFDSVTVAEDLWVTPLDAHPNARAHAIIASAMAATLPVPRRSK